MENETPSSNKDCIRTIGEMQTRKSKFGPKNNTACKFSQSKFMKPDFLF